MQYSENGIKVYKMCKVFRLAMSHTMDFVLGLFTLSAIFAHVTYGSTLRVCSGYHLMTMFDELCHDNMFQSSSLAFYQMEQRGTVTAADILTYIERDCGHWWRPYKQCSEQLVSHCDWGVQLSMEEAVRNNQEMLCQGQNVAPWVRTYMTHGFSMDLACYHHISDVIARCERQGQTETSDLDPETISLPMIAWATQLVMEERLPCTIEELRKVNEAPSNCTSSWVDQLFYLWVFRENHQPIYYLTGEQQRLLNRLKLEESFPQSVWDLVNETT